jgi:ketosteroid isomerase-like protein
VNVTALTDELVLLNSIAKWDITFKQGEKMNVDALATMLWMKENNGWKIIFLHESWQ